MTGQLPPSAEATRLLQDYLDHAIPLVPHMQVHVEGLDERALVLKAPLAPNRNHIGTVFGGSLNALATLACWGFVWLALHGRNAQIVIHEGQMKFLKPATADFEARCRIPDDTQLDAFIEQFERRGRARIELAAEVWCPDVRVATFSGSFAARRAQTPEQAA